jgi:hypothetical protein
VNGTVEGTTLKAKATYRVKFVDKGKTRLNIYVKLEATAGVNGWASAAEIGVLETENVKN